MLVINYFWVIVICCGFVISICVYIVWFLVKGRIFSIIVGFYKFGGILIVFKFFDKYKVIKILIKSYINNGY